MAEERLEEIRAGRLAKREALIEVGADPYPAEVRRTHTVAEFLSDFEVLLNEEAPVLLLGRVVAVREHGALAFLDMRDGSGQVQLQVTASEVPTDIFERLKNLDQGDFIQATGKAVRTKRGTETLAVAEFHIVSKSLRPLPDSWYGLKDHETRFRQREIDLLLNEESRKVVGLRHTVIQRLRNFLTEQGFLEVETPLLQPMAGGAAAKPFATHHNALDIDLFLRIAPELYLKRLLVAGYEQVFEIGRNFRNEGISKQHNPEFTMLEFYWAYKDYEDLMEFTDVLLAELVETVSPNKEIQWQGETYSFAGPLERLRYVDLLKNELDVDILEEKDPAVYVRLFKERGLEVPAAQTYTKLVDELYKELIRPKLKKPVIVYDYPAEMLPLAKANATDPRIAEAFQVVVAGMELVKAYTELNDPVEQRKRFEVQQAQREGGDEEAQQIDEDYLRAMEQGMPPVAGYGLGIDRLIMLLADMPTLRDTILFPLLKPE